MKKINEVRPQVERAYTIRFEAPRALKQAKPLVDRNPKRPVAKKFC